MYEEFTLAPEFPNDFIRWRPSSGGSVEILDIMVSSERGVGRGTRLIDLVIEHFRSDPTCRTLWAMTRGTNLMAQRFYVKRGFRMIARVPDFYLDASSTAESTVVVFSRVIGGGT